MAALCLALLGCTDLKAAKPHDEPDGGDASTSDGNGGSGGKRADRDGGPNAPGDGDAASDGGPDQPSTPTDSADDPAAVAGGGLQLQCDTRSGACVAGSIVSGGGDVGHGSATLPGGGTVTLSDDGFELGATTCDGSGKVCVTGEIAP